MHRKSIAKTPDERFWPNVELTPSCWLWRGGRSKNGYGIFEPAPNQRTTSAHRFSWELNVGPIPDGLCVCHTCDVKSCVNPAHLWLGTKKDNAQDRDRKGRGAWSSGRMPRSTRLSEDDVRIIRSTYQEKQPGCVQSLARRFGVAQSTIYYVIAQTTWKHVK